MILCCGEALIETPPTDAPGARPAWSAHPGGAVFNTAIALGRLGAPAGLLTGLSTDLFGDMLRTDLDAAGVDRRLCVTSDHKTALAFLTLSDGQARYSFHDAGSAHRDFAPAAALPDAVTTLFFGGISLASEPCGTALDALLHRERAGRVVMLDPNIRPDFVADAAVYRARLSQMIAAADIVKLSDEDLTWLMPQGGTPDDQAQAILQAGPSVVLVTRGGDGAVAATRSGHRITVPATPVTVVDTVGAGDTFNAGFLAKLAERDMLAPAAIATISKEDLRAATAHAVAAAAFVVARAGANPPWRSDMIG